MKIAVFVGTRPEIIKMQPVIKEIEMRRYELLFIHTGQHYQFSMADIFISELNLRSPSYGLSVKAASQGAQTANVIKKSEVVMLKERPDIVLVEGDTNSAMGVAIAASKLGIKIGHVEAGCRSFEKEMPEEINRVLIADLANLHFAPTPNSKVNLLREGIKNSMIFVTGHPIVDLIASIKEKKSQSLQTISKIDLADYVLVTVHRRENIESEFRLGQILLALDKISKEVPVVFPCHPHTRIQIKRFGLEKYLTNIKVLDPVGYIESLNLIENARYVLTDSGGIQQEAAILKTPCITMRDVTEWIETVQIGVNFLAGFETKKILKVAKLIEKKHDQISKSFARSQSIFGSSGVSRRILNLIERKTQVV